MSKPTITFRLGGEWSNICAGRITSPPRPPPMADEAKVFLLRQLPDARGSGYRMGHKTLGMGERRMGMLWLFCGLFVVPIGWYLFFKRELNRNQTILLSIITLTIAINTWLPLNGKEFRLAEGVSTILLICCTGSLFKS